MSESSLDSRRAGTIPTALKRLRFLRGLDFDETGEGELDEDIIDSPFNKNLRACLENGAISPNGGRPPAENELRIGEMTTTAEVKRETIDKDHYSHVLQLLRDLKCKDRAKIETVARELKQFVDMASRKFSAETFTNFMNNLTPKLFALIQSSDVNEQMGGLYAIDRLIDVSSEDDEAKVIRFSNYLRNFFVQPSSSKQTLHMASKTLGHLARAGGTLTADFVDFEVKRALEWLQGERYDHNQEHRRLTACLVSSLKKYYQVVNS